MKTFSVVLTHEAEISLTATYEYIYTLNPTAANNWLDGIQEKIKGLANFPNKGAIIPEAEKNDTYSHLHQIFYSMNPSGNTYRIIYMIEDDVYKIVNVITIRSSVQKPYGE